MLADPAGSMLLRARIALPLDAAPICDAGVRIDPPRLTRVGPWKEVASEPAFVRVDLGAVVLLPGFLNAHCHLDYTDMAGLLPPPRSFCDWIKSITTLKAGWSYTEFAQSWLNGAQMLLESGCTTVADIEAVPELLPEVWDATPLRCVSFLEMTGVRSRRQPERILREALDCIRRLKARKARGTIGLGPHAPYSTPPELLRLIAAAPVKTKVPVTIHVSESAEEFDMFTRQSGPMYEWIARNQRDMSDCGLGTPVEHLARNGLLDSKVLAIHANYLTERDIALLAAARSPVVHCPRSHEYFRHGEFPYAQLRGAGVRVSLGTDSLATIRHTKARPARLNLFEEMRAFARRHPAAEPHEILRMVTVHPAAALGRAGELGALRAGALADLIAIPFDGAQEDACAGVIAHRGPLHASMIGGAWALPAHS